MPTFATDEIPLTRTSHAKTVRGARTLAQRLATVCTETRREAWSLAGRGRKDQPTNGEDPLLIRAGSSDGSAGSPRCTESARSPGDGVTCSSRVLKSAFRAFVSAVFRRIGNAQSSTCGERYDETDHAKSFFNSLLEETVTCPYQRRIRNPLEHLSEFYDWDRSANFPQARGPKRRIKGRPYDRVRPTTRCTASYRKIRA